jgi:hypothetical protein
MAGLAAGPPDEAETARAAVEATVHARAEILMAKG